MSFIWTKPSVIEWIRRLRPSDAPPMNRSRAASLGDADLQLVPTNRSSAPECNATRVPRPGAVRRRHPTTRTRVAAYHGTRPAVPTDSRTV